MISLHNTIGYSIGKIFWSKGYGKKLLATMIQHSKNIDCQPIKAIVYPDNLASIAILKKQGFHIAAINSTNQLLTYHLQIHTTS